jgi:membrane-associated phospholipid phosphatase
MLDASRAARCRLALVAATVVVSISAPARAACLEHPITDVGARLSRLGEPRALGLVAAGVVSPFLFAPTGLDWSARTFYLRDVGGRYDPERFTVSAPFSLVGALAFGWTLAAVTGDCGGSAVVGRSLAAVSFAAATQALVKLAVGRTYPATDPSRTFVDDGRAYEAVPLSTLGAWPSGHTMTTVAFAAAIRTALPRRAGAFRYAGYALAAVVAAGMLYGDHHWTSDVVSGALFGEAIGASFGAPANRSSAGQAGVHLVPGPSGVVVVGSFH